MNRLDQFINDIETSLGNRSKEVLILRKDNKKALPFIYIFLPQDLMSSPIFKELFTYISDLHGDVLEEVVLHIKGLSELIQELEKGIPEYCRLFQHQTEGITVFGSRSLYERMVFLSADGSEFSTQELIALLRRRKEHAEQTIFRIMRDLSRKFYSQNMLALQLDILENNAAVQKNEVGLLGDPYNDLYNTGYRTAFSGQVSIARRLHDLIYNSEIFNKNKLLASYFLSLLAYIITNKDETDLGVSRKDLFDLFDCLEKEFSHEKKC